MKIVLRALFCNIEYSMDNVKNLKMRLAAIGKSPQWLAEVTQYTYSSIRHALSENSPHKSAKILRVLEEAICMGEAKKGHEDSEIKGLFMLDFRAGDFAAVDAASRIVNAPSIKEYCKDCITLRTKEIMARSKSPLASDGEIPYKEKQDELES